MRAVCDACLYRCMPPAPPPPIAAGCRRISLALTIALSLALSVALTFARSSRCSALIEGSWIHRSLPVRRTRRHHLFISLMTHRWIVVAVVPVNSVVKAFLRAAFGPMASGDVRHLAGEVHGVLHEQVRPRGRWPFREPGPLRRGSAAASRGAG